MAQKTEQPITSPSAAKVSQLYKTIENRAPASMPPSEDAAPPKKDIDDELLRRQRLTNDDVEQNIRLKRVVLNRLFWFLGIETFCIFLFTLFQATHWLGFNLEKDSFNVITTATILQIAGMLFVAVRYLFPTSNNKGKGKNDDGA